MPVNTSNTILSTSTDGTSYSKLCDITSYPDMGSAPSKLDSTDLTATVMKTSILGLQESPELTFEANYTKDAYKAVKAMEGSNKKFKLSFNDTDGAFTWEGQLSVYANGGGVDEVRKMTIVCSASTEIEFID